MLQTSFISPKKPIISEERIREQTQSILYIKNKPLNSQTLLVKRRSLSREPRSLSQTSFIFVGEGLCSEKRIREQIQSKIITPFLTFPPWHCVRICKPAARLSEGRTGLSLCFGPAISLTPISTNQREFHSPTLK